MADIEQRARFEAWAKGENLVGRTGWSPSAWIAWGAWQAALASQTQVPDGWKLVPPDPGASMINAGRLFGLTPNQACAVYQSMIAAVPAPEVSNGN